MQCWGRSEAFLLPPVVGVTLALCVKLVTQKFELEFAAAATQPRKRLLTGSAHFRKWDVGRLGGLPLENSGFSLIFFVVVCFKSCACWFVFIA